jgi:hypothetical protein
MKRPREATQEFLIRVREGMTRKVYEVGAHSKDEEATLDGREDKSTRYPMEPVPIKAWTEGPCKRIRLDEGVCELLNADRLASTDGHEKYLGEDFNTLLLIAGGSGVSYTLSTSMDLVRRARAMHVGSDCKTIAVATKRLSFVWMVKTPGERGREASRGLSRLCAPIVVWILLEQTEWIADHLKEMCLMAPPGFLNITIFVTSKRKSGEPPIMAGYVTDDRRDKVEEQTSEREKQPRSKAESNTSTSVERVQHEARVELRSGRPDFGELLQREMDHSAYTE